MSTEKFHPDLRPWARLLPRTLITGRLSVRVIRAAQVLTELRPPGAAAKVETVSLGSDVHVRVHRPPNPGPKTPALLWIHGGGYVIGRAQQDDPVCARFARDLGIVVAAVDYRLAPEHPYPASLEDCYRGLVWLSQQPDIDTSRIAIGGGSAGGGLAAALALLARDRGEIPLALQLLVYPMVDDRSGQRTDLDESNFRLWGTRSNRYGWQSYLGNADPAVAVPARRTDLAGSPPAWIGVGTLDLFHDEDLAYAERLRAAGVPCDLTTIDGAFHGFDLIAAKTSVSRSFFAAQCDALRAAFARGTEQPAAADG